MKRLITLLTLALISPAALAYLSPTSSGGGGGGGSSPTGSANTISYFNGSGALSSNANFRLSETGGWMVISTLGAGAGPSNVGATGGAGLVVGNVAGGSSILSTSTGAGQIAFGNVASSGQVSGQGNGSMAGGYASNSGIVTTENDGSIAIGVANNSGQVSANDPGTSAFGWSDQNSIVGARGSGSMVLGYATGASTVIDTKTLKYGQFAGGYATTAGAIEANGNGGFVFGSATTSGSLTASASGAVAFGRADGSSHNIQASGNGAMAIGNATSAAITASGDGSVAIGSPASALAATGTSSQAFGDGNTSSGALSTTFGLGNVNASYAALVAGRYASMGSPTAGSWVSSDPLFVLGNGTGSGAKANAFSVLKNGVTTVGGQLLVTDGTSGSPGVAFTSEATSGLYRVGTNEIGLTAGGAQVLDMKKSTSGFGNLGMGGPASVSDSYPLLIQRDVTSAGVYAQMSNTDTAAYSKATWQLAADNGNNNGEISLFTSATPLDAYANAMTVRPSGSTGQLSLIGGDLATAKVIVYTGGAYDSTGRTAVFNSDHSTTLKGLLQLPVQGSGSTPTCGSSQDGSLALTNGHKLCVCNGTAWKNASDGSTACTF